MDRSKLAREFYTAGYERRHYPIPLSTVSSTARYLFRMQYRSGATQANVDQGVPLGEALNAWRTLLRRRTLSLSRVGVGPQVD